MTDEKLGVSPDTPIAKELARYLQDSYISDACVSLQAGLMSRDALRVICEISGFRCRALEDFRSSGMLRFVTSYKSEGLSTKFFDALPA